MRLMKSYFKYTHSNIMLKCCTKRELKWLKLENGVKKSNNLQNRHNLKLNGFIIGEKRALSCVIICFLTQFPCVLTEVYLFCKPFPITAPNKAKFFLICSKNFAVKTNIR